MKPHLSHGTVAIRLQTRPREGEEKREETLDHARKEEGVSELRLLDRRTAYDGRVLKMDIERLLLPDGGTTELEIIRHSGASVVVPVTAEGEILRAAAALGQ